MKLDLPLLQVRPIGVVRSPYVRRFGTPRQATVTAGIEGEGPARATLELDPSFVPEAALRDLEGFEYVWVIAWLDRTTSWNATVRPPRGPRVKRGLFATRTPNRPNPVGLSALKIIAVRGHCVEVEGLDLLDGTPILDIKPYVPYADAFPDARAGWLDALDEAMDAPDRPTRPPGWARRRMAAEAAEAAGEEPPAPDGAPDPEG